VQVAPGAIALASGATPWTILDLVEKLNPPVPVLPADEPAPKPAKIVTVSDTLKRALRAIPAAFGSVQPTESRKLEAAELKALTDEAVAIREVTTPLGERLKAISEVIRHHMDHCPQDAENYERIARGEAKGHLLLAAPGEPYEVAVEGYDDAWQQRYIAGKPSVVGAEVDSLYKDGTITREEFLSCTSVEAARFYDEHKLARFIKRNPERGLQILAMITHRAPATASVYAPKK
jgi:hypothetical protein